MVWIEILIFSGFRSTYDVTTLRVVWIEMSLSGIELKIALVTTLRVVWIEIYGLYRVDNLVNGHHLAGGVD